MPTDKGKFQWGELGPRKYKARIICSYCGCQYGTQMVSRNDGMDTHGICKSCLPEMKKALKEMKDED